MYTAEADGDIPTVTICNNTTGEIDIYKGQKQIVKNITPNGYCKIKTNTQLILQASAVHCWHSPAFIDPSDEKERTFKLSFSRNSFKLQRVYG